MDKSTSPVSKFAADAMSTQYNPRFIPGAARFPEEIAANIPIPPAPAPRKQQRRGTDLGSYFLQNRWNQTLMVQQSFGINIGADGSQLTANNGSFSAGLLEDHVLV